MKKYVDSKCKDEPVYPTLVRPIKLGKFEGDGNIQLVFSEPMIIPESIEIPDEKMLSFGLVIPGSKGSIDSGEHKKN